MRFFYGFNIYHPCSYELAHLEMVSTIVHQLTRNLSMEEIEKSGFANYAEENNFIYNDYTKVAEQTNNLVNSPYSSVS